MDASARFQLGAMDQRNGSLNKIKAAGRKLFLSRGYHETRPQDIAREAGLGHGTFYLHFRDKRDCFLAVLDDARMEFCSYMRMHVSRGDTIEQTIAHTLETIYAFSDQNPGLLNAVMADDVLFDAEGTHPSSEMQLWSTEWALMLREDGGNSDKLSACEPNIVGQAVLGAINSCRLQSDRQNVSREQVKAILIQLLTRALTSPNGREVREQS